MLSEQLQKLFGALPVILFITVVVAVILAASHWNVRPTSAVIGWLIALLVVSLARLTLCLSFRSKARPPETNLYWYRGFCLLTLLAGLVWGGSAWLLFAADSPMHQMLLTFVIAGVGAAGVVNLSVRWQCAWLFLIPALVPLVFRFQGLDVPMADAIALLMGLFVLTMMGFSVQIACWNRLDIRRGIELRKQSEQLRLQQERYSSLIESTRAIFWEASPDPLVLTYISNEAESILGYPTEDWISDPAFWVEHVHSADRFLFQQFLRDVVRRAREHTFDYRMIAADGHTVWLKNVINLIDADGAAQKLVGVMIDISELKTTEQNLEYTADLQRRMVDASRQFLQATPSSLDDAIENVLANVGSGCRADRSYLIRFSGDHQYIDNTHEWCADGISAEIENLHDVPADVIPQLTRRLLQREVVHIPQVALLDREWMSEKSIFDQQQIQSLVVVPVFAVDRLIGMIGFDSVVRRRTWQDSEIALLRILGDLIGATLARADVDQALLASEQTRAYAESLARMGSWELCIESNRFIASAEWRNVTGCYQQSLYSEDVLNLVPDYDIEHVRHALNETLTTGKPFDIEHRIRRCDDQKIVWIKVHAELNYRNGEPFRLKGFAQDISERREAEKKLYQLAHYDSLTRLPNRVLMLDRLRQSLKRAKRQQTRLALLFIDLDGFKMVNDTLGHDVGDQVLIDASARLSLLLRRQDTISRIGGDEFLVLLDDIDQTEDVAAIAKKIVQAFRSPFELDQHRVVLTASIGIAIAPNDGTDDQNLMRNADSAMYQAKHDGRDGYRFFTESMNKTVSRQFKLEEALRGALAGGELYLEYQPIVDMDGRNVVGAEALLRWSSPVFGDVDPGEFISIAEHIGIIGEIGDFVFSESIRTVAGWRHRSGRDIYVSVNVSPRQFRSTRLAWKVLEQLRGYGLPGSALNIEITESVLLASGQDVHGELKVLGDFGVGITMDDFGTGYASLSYLRQYPFSGMKIDREFIHRIDVERQNRQLALSVIALGHSLSMTVIAEGIETQQQFDILHEAGCRFGQGFLLGRAGVAGDVESRLQNHSSVV